MNKEDNPQDVLLLSEAPLTCCCCKMPLCLRMQVINLAVDNCKEMLCLNCLGAESNKTGEEVLRSMKTYINNRECFNKQWQRYVNIKYCPYPNNCLPNTCFINNEQ